MVGELKKANVSKYLMCPLVFKAENQTMNAECRKGCLVSFSIPDDAARSCKEVWS